MRRTRSTASRSRRRAARGCRSSRGPRRARARRRRSRSGSEEDGAGRSDDRRRRLRGPRALDPGRQRQLPLARRHRQGGALPRRPGARQAPSLRHRGAEGPDDSRGGRQLRPLGGRRARPLPSPGPFGIAPVAADQKTSDGVLDLARLQMRVDPPAEWQQEFVDAWRILRDWYYDPGMNGVDWPAVRARYGELIPYVASRGDLDYVFSELAGELASGHVYVSPAPPEVERDGARQRPARRRDRRRSLRLLRDHQDLRRRELARQHPLAADRAGGRRRRSATTSSPSTAARPRGSTTSIGCCSTPPAGW